MLAAPRVEAVIGGRMGLIHFQQVGEAATICRRVDDAAPAPGEDVDCTHCLRIARARFPDALRDDEASASGAPSYACPGCAHSIPHPAADTGIACGRDLTLKCRPHSPTPRYYTPKTTGEEAV